MTAYAIMGDSHVEGLAPFLARELADRGDKLVATLGHPGWSTGRFLREEDTPGWVYAHPADVYLIMLGTNDVGVPDTTYRSNVAALANAAESTGARAVWLGPPAVVRPDIAAGVSHAADVQRVALAGTRDAWLDLRPLTPGKFRDGVHLLASGYSDLANAIAKVLQARMGAKAESGAWKWIAGAVGAGLLMLWGRGR